MGEVNNELEEALDAARNSDNEAASDVYTYERTPLVIDNDLRTISVPKNYVFGVYNDKDVLAVPFEMPRYYSNIDLSEYDIQINYLNASGTGDIYEVENKTIEADKIKFTWLLGRGVFLKEGHVTFVVCLRQLDGDIIANEFNTTRANGVVLDGLEVENTDDPAQYSILARIKGYLVDAKYYAEKAEEVAEPLILEEERLTAVENSLSGTVTNGWNDGNEAVFAHDDIELFRIQNGGGSGGTSNYVELENLPKVEGHTLIGDKTFPDLGLGVLSNIEIEALLS